MHSSWKPPAFSIGPSAFYSGADFGGSLGLCKLGSLHRQPSLFRSKSSIPQRAQGRTGPSLQKQGPPTSQLTHRSSARPQQLPFRSASPLQAWDSISKFVKSQQQTVQRPAAQGQGSGQAIPRGKNRRTAPVPPKLDSKPKKIPKSGIELLQHQMSQEAKDGGPAGPPMKKQRVEGVPGKPNPYL